MRMNRAGILALLLLATLPTQSQRLARLPDYFADDSITKNPEFTFARMMYTSNSWGEGWTTDYPKADHQFILGLRGWVKSLLSISNQPVAISLLDPGLFSYPFIYCVEPGQLELSAKEATALREYLDRGGFLMMDDFWGEYEWQNVQLQLRKVYPETEIREIPLDHPIFHCYFDIDQVIQVPNVGNWIRRQRTDEKGGIVPHYEGIVTPEGRIAILIARNTDNGDAWEWIDEPRYALKFGLAAYRLGMNAIVYSMTH